MRLNLTYVINGLFVLAFSTATYAQKPDCDHQADFAFIVDQLEVVFLNSASEESYKYNWRFGDNIQSRDRSANHTFKTSGTYNVCLNVKTGCKSTNICQLVQVPADPVEDELGILKLYPNPTTGSFKIRVEEIKGYSLTLEVTDISGKDIFYTEFQSTMPTYSTTVDLGNEASGIYIVNLMIDGQQSTQSFFKL